MEELRQAVRADQLGSFVRMKGGYPFPLAGAIYWIGLGTAGARLTPESWILVAFVFSGAIFPLAWLLSRLLGNDFLKDQTATGDVIGPAMIAMLLFWPIAVSAFWEAPELVPLIVAIGMSQHWPVIGWSYGKPGLYGAHAVVRAVGAFAIWNWIPDGRFTLLAYWVAAIYLATVVAILLEARREAITIPATRTA